MDIDIILEPDLTPEEITELGLLAESAGINRLWTQNYAQSRDAIMSLVPLAMASERIKIGAMVISPWEMHPLKMANLLLTLNEFSKGRAAICIGGGGEWNAVMDIPVERRVRTVHEATEIVRAACVEHDVTNYRGQLFKSTRFKIDWPKEEPPLVYTGAGREQMVRMSTTCADGIVLSDAVPPVVVESMGYVREENPKRDASLGPLRTSNFWAWHVKEDREAALTEAKRELIIRSMLSKDHIGPILSEEDVAAVHASLPAFFGAYHDRSGEIRGVPQRIIDALLDGITTTGDLTEMDKHIARMNEFKAAGLDELALRLHDDPADAIRIIGQHVVPAVR